MKAAFLEDYGKMGIRDVPIPEIGPDDVLIKIEAVGVCGSDLHAYLGKHQFRFPPVMLGHEGAGTIYRMGENVHGFKIGDRVTMDPTLTCGECPQCLEGNTNLCPSRRAPGTKSWYEANGTWAEYFPIQADHVYKINDDVSFARAALAEPMANSMHILSLVKNQKKDSICVIGCGTIGLFAIFLAKLQGYKIIIGSDPMAYNRRIAEAVGATATVDPTVQDIVSEVKKSTNEQGADVTVLAAGFPGIFDQASDITKRTGEVMLIAMMTDPIPFDSYRYLVKQQTLQGCQLYNTPDFEKCIEIINNTSIDLSPFITHTMPLEDAGKALELLKTKYEDVIKITLTVS